MNLLSSPTGHMTNLSTVPLNESQGIHAVPLFPAMSDPSGRQGLVRVINRTGTAGDVRIEAFDDTQWDYAPLTLPIGPGEAVQFNSNDLEQGNPGKGLVLGTGPGQGDWRLELTSGVDIEVLSYVRAWDGLLTSMHDVVPGEEDGMHRVSMFNAEGYEDRGNRVRLINPASVPAEVSVTGIDAAGQLLGDGLTATGSGGGLADVLGGGTGGGRRGRAARLVGAAPRRMAIDGRVRTADPGDEPVRQSHGPPYEPVHGAGARPGNGVAPAGSGRYGAADRGKRRKTCSSRRSLRSCRPSASFAICRDERRTSRLSRLQFSPDTVEGHVALNLAVFEALLAVLEEDEQVEDPVAYILNKVQGVSHGGGVQLTAGTDNYASMERFLGLLGEAVASVGDHAGDAVRGRDDGVGPQHAAASGDRVRRKGTDGG